MECKNEKLEQYGRRCCLKVGGVPFVENESLDDVLGKVKSLITESGCEIPEMWLLTEPIELAEDIKIKLEMFPV